MPFSDSLIGDNDFDPVTATESLIRQQTQSLPPDSPLDTRMLNTRLARKLNQPAPRVKVEKPAGEVSRADDLDFSSEGIPVETPDMNVDTSLDLSQYGVPASPDVVAPTAATEKPKHNAFMRGLVTGMVEQNPQLTAEALEGISHLAPDGPIGDVLRSGSKDLHKLSKMNPAEYKTRAGSMWDIKGFDDAMTWAGENLGQSISSMAPPLVGGVAGGALGGRIGGKVGAIGGAALGAGTPSALMNYGEVYKALKDEKVDPKVASEYAAYATPALVGLDFASLGPIITRLGGIDLVKREIARGIAKRIAVEAAKGAGREGLTEAAQEVVKDATVSLASGKPFWTMDTLKGAVESGVAGALGGAAMGGVGGIRSDSTRTAPTPPHQGGESTAAGAAPGGGPTPGSGPGMGQSSPEDIADFVRRANESNPNAAAQEQMRAEAEAARAADPANMTEAQRTHAYAAAREAHGFEPDFTILKNTGMSDLDIAKLSEQERIDAVIRAGSKRTAGGPQAEQKQSSEQTTSTANGQQQADRKQTADDADYSTLRAYGYSDEDIDNMSPRQRAREAADARAEGIDPAKAAEQFKRPESGKNERPESGAENLPPDDDSTGFKGAFDSMGKGIGESLRDHLWSRVEAGELTENSTMPPSALLQGAKMIRARGGLKTREQFDAYAKEQAELESGPGFQQGMRDLVAKYSASSPGAAKTTPVSGDGTRQAPITPATAEDVKSVQPVEPKSDAQAEAENYKHAHIELPQLGLKGKRSISVETGVGQERKGVDADGKPWSVTMNHGAYGRIKGTKGADGQPLDIFIGPRPDSPHVFVVDQHHPGGGGFDEHKIMAGYASPIDALRAYSASYTDRGGDRIGGVTAMTPEQFQDWLDNGDHTKPVKKPASTAHKREEAGSTSPLTEAPVRDAEVPKADAEGGTTSPAKDHNSDTGQNVPENRSTLKAQQNQLIAGERVAQMFPKGTREMPLPPGMERVETPRGIFHFDPKKADADTIKKVSAEGRENELLGLGSIPKADIARREAAGEKPVAIVERTPDGVEVRAAAGTEATAEQQRAELEKGKSPGNTVAIEDINETLKKRAEPAATEPMTLMQFIASKGGIKPSDELRALDLTGKVRVKVPGRRGFFPVVTEKGEHHDDMRRAAQEAGYFPADKPNAAPENSLRDFYDALDEEHNRNNPLHAQGEEHVKTKRQQQSIKESSEHAHERALIDAQDDIEAEYPGIPSDLRDLAAKIMVDERESDIDTAVERASVRLVDDDDSYNDGADYDVARDIADTFGEGVFDEIHPATASEDGEPAPSARAEKPRSGEGEEDRADGEHVSDSGAEVVQGESQGVARPYPYTADRTQSKQIVPLPMELSEFQEITDEWSALFADPDSKTNLETKLKNGPFIPIEEAQKRIDQWRADAAAQAADPETFRANSSKTVLSLYDLSGNWSRPWAEAGYNVLTFDIQTGQDVNDFSVEYFTDNYDITDVYAILIAQPCTDFAVSGSKHFAAKDARGDTAKSVDLVHQSLRTVEYFRPKVWALENPVSRIEKLTGLPKWRLLFNPNNFGSPYTKKTVLWGKFNADLPTANVEPIEGSKMHIKYGGKSQATKNARSETPEGFAYSFFKANNYADRSAEDRLPDDYPEVSGAVTAALNAGVTEARINELMENTYGNYEYDEARQALIDEVAKVRGAEDERDNAWALRQREKTGNQVDANVEKALSFADQYDAVSPAFADGIRSIVAMGNSIDQKTLDYYRDHLAESKITTERTTAGEQTVLPGAERIGQGEQAQRAADRGLKPKVAQRAADEGLFGDSMDQADLLDMVRRNVDTVEDALGEDADKVAQVDITRAAELMAENDGMDPATAFGQAVAENAVEQGFITEQEAVDAYGEQVKDVLEAGRQGALGGGAHVEPGRAESGEVSPGGAEEAGIVPRSREAGREGTEGETAVDGRRAVNEPAGREQAAGDEAGDTAQDRDAAEDADTAVVAPPGYAVDTPSKLHRIEAQRKGNYSAVARRINPWSVEKGYGNTPEEAQRDALRRVGAPGFAAQPATEAPKPKASKEYLDNAIATFERELANAPKSDKQAQQHFRGKIEALRAQRQRDFGDAPIGVNAKGQELFEDENGVRYRKERGIRIQEPVTLRPTRDRGLVPEIGERSPEWQTVADLPPDEQARNWWRNDLSPYGREQVVKAANLPESVAKTLWHNLTPERQRRLSAIRGTDADPIMMREAPTWAEIMAALPKDAAGHKDVDLAARLMFEISGIRQPSYRDLTPSQQTELLARLRGDTVAPQEEANGVPSTVPERNAGAGPEDVQSAEPRGEAGSVRQREGAGSASDVRGADEGRAEGAGRVSEGAGGERGRGSRASGADRVSRERTDDAADGRAERAAEPAANVEGENYVIKPGALQEDRSPLQKAKDNYRAIVTMKMAEEAGRPATMAEQDALARYVGWGGLKNVFPDTDGNYGKGFEDIGRDLKAALTPEEYETARRSIQYAHYTAEDVVRSMWDAVARMGFREGQVFEPGMGTGNFAGMMPTDIAANVQYAGVEMDHITAGIAKMLYPKYGVRREDFTKTPLPENYYDLVIGNPPFADIAVKADPKYKQGFLLHDYFFAKSIDAVRPGGLLAFVTSAGTMNKVDPSAREYIADRADLLGAIRLPNDAFAKNAGTRVTTDIIFLRKRMPGDIAGDRSWTDVVPTELADRNGGITTGNVNRYFVDNPDMILGEHGMFDQLQATQRYGVRSRPGTDLKSELQKAIQRLPADVMTPWHDANSDRTDDDFTTTEKKEGTFYIGPNGDLHQVQSGLGRPVQQRGKGVSNGKSAADIERIKGLIPIRDALRDVYAADLKGDTGNAERARAALNRHYDAFVAKFGLINKAVIQKRRPTIIQQEAARSAAREEARYADRDFREGSFDARSMIAQGEALSVIARARAEAREKAQAEGREFDEGEFDVDEIPDIIIDKRPNVDPFMDDPESYRLRAIERYDEATDKGFKSPVFTENVITRERVPEISSVNDALLYSLSQYGRVNVPAMAELVGKSESDVLDELRDQVFRVPGTNDTYQTRGEYLSGDVRKKLNIARQQAERDPDFRRNVAALEAAQPTPLAPSQIHASLGMPWIPAETVQEFGTSELGLTKLSVKYFPGLATWVVSGDTDSVAAQTTYGTADRRAPALISDALNRQNPKIYDKVKDIDGREHSVLNPDKTSAAQDKIAAIKEKFSDWIWRDTDRADKLAQFYNEKFNNLVVREYDGSYLTTPGVAANWSWRPHQKRGIARIIQSGNTYLAHAVGAGKTSEMIGAVMEQRRLGLVRKPMIAVPNHMLAQFTKEFYEQYPTARLAIADERRFHMDRRKQFIANVAMDDLDAVIITHSAFGMIPVSDAFQNGIVQKEIDQYRTLLSQLQGGDSRITRSRVEKQIERLEQRLEGKGTRRKDQVFTFEEMGIDQLYVDEAHLFRKLDFSTQMSSLKGVSPEGSQMAWDLYVKAKYLDTVRPGRGLVLASGTPVTNTMAELYTVSRYLQPQVLAERDLEKFDAWAGAFGESVAELEQDAAGNYKSVSRFAKFVNVAELSAMVRQVMDVVTSRQLEQYVTRPKLVGGKRIMNLAEQSPEYKVYGRELAARMKAIQNRKGPPKKGDDIMLTVINDGRHAAIDMRLVEGGSKTSTPSKLDMLIDNVARIHKETARKKFYKPAQGGEYETKVANVGPATQMIFANLGLSGKRGFSVPDYIRSELVRRGVPKSEIAYIYDYKNSTAKQRLFNDMNEGKVRILIGSTAKMATGVNAQRRLYAIHNLDPLWFPSDDEQRNGRGIRQGNMNPEIEINDYSTKGTYDSTMWGMMEKKARFIQAFFEGDPSLRDMDDLGEASQYEQAKALTTNDPRLIKLTELKQELERATRRKTAFESEAYALRQNRASSRTQIEHYSERIEQTKKDIAQRIDVSGDNFKGTVGKETFDKRVEFGEALYERLEKVAATGTINGAIKVAEVGGFPIYAAGRRSLIKGDNSIEIDVYVGLNGGREREVRYGTSAIGTVRSIESVLTGLDSDLAEYEARKAKAEKFLTDSNDKVKARFEGNAEIDRLTDQVRALQAELAASSPEETPPDDGGGGGLASMARDDIGNLTPAAERSLPEIMDLLRGVVQQIAGNFHVSFTDTAIPVENVSGYGEKKISGWARGMYYPMRAAIRLALIGPNKKIIKTAFHESIHAIEDRLMNEKERELMKRETPAMRRWLKKHEDNTYSDDTIDNLAGYEVRAHAGEHYMYDRLQGMRAEKAGAGLHIGVRRWFERLWNALQRLKNGLRGLGFKTWKDIFDEALQGEFAKREASRYNQIDAEDMASADQGFASAMPGSGGGRRGGPPNVPETLNEKLSDANFNRLAAVSRALRLGNINVSELRTQIQDKFIRVREAEQSVDGPVPTSQSAYQAESLYYGRAGEQLEKLERDHLDPLIEDMKRRDVSLEDFNEYLYAKHAPERNAAMDEINHPELNGGRDLRGRGSGMSDEEAAAVMERLANRLPDFEALEKRVRKIIDDTRDLLVDSGLISQDVADAWAAKYQFYVPLRGFAEGFDESGYGQGKGYDTRGPETKQAMGRMSRAAGPLAYVMHQAEMAIVRAEKNRVGNAWLRFVRSHPDRDRWSVDTPPVKKEINPRTGLVTQVEDRNWYLKPDVFVTKVGGRPVLIQIHGKEGENLVRALKNMGSSNMNAFVRFMHMLTTTMSRLSTQWNPNFVVPNFARDVSEALINLNEQDQKNFIKNFSKHLFPSIKGAFNALRGANGGKYGDAFRQFDKAGGRIRFFGLENHDDIDANINRRLRRLEGGAINNVRELGRAAADAFEVVNGAIENATRLAAYMAAKDTGMSDADAAMLARNLTVDFNKKGELGSTLNAFYMFINASIQGSVRIARAMKNKNVRRAVLGLLAIGALGALYNFGAGGEDDAGEDYYSKLPPWIRDKNLIIMWPKGYGNDGGYAKIPLPFGFSPFHVIGNRLAGVFLGKDKPSDAMWSVMTSIGDAFNPLGEESSVFGSFLPSVFRPGAHIANNKNWNGNPLYPEYEWQKNRPDSEQSFRSTSEFSKTAAREINRATGGSPYKSGWLDWHPGSIDHVLESITGGLGKFVGDIVATGGAIYRGDPFDINKAPILRRFAGTANDAKTDQMLYYKNRDEARKSGQGVLRQAQKDRGRGINKDEATEFINDNKGIARGESIFKNADRQMKPLREQMEKAKADESLDANAKRSKVEAITEKMRTIQNRARKEYMELKRGTP